MKEGLVAGGLMGLIFYAGLSLPQPVMLGLIVVSLVAAALALVWVARADRPAR